MSDRPDEDRCAWGKCRQQADCYLARVPFCRHHAARILTSDEPFKEEIVKHARKEWHPRVNTESPK